MSENMQEILDAALVREHRELPTAEIDLLAHEITGAPNGGYVVYLLYMCTTPPWDSGSVMFGERTSLRYSVQLPGEGGARGEVGQVR